MSISFLVVGLSSSSLLWWCGPHKTTTPPSPHPCLSSSPQQTHKHTLISFKHHAHVRVLHLHACTSNPIPTLTSQHNTQHNTTHSATLAISCIRTFPLPCCARKNTHSFLSSPLQIHTGKRSQLYFKTRLAPPLQRHTSTQTHTHTSCGPNSVPICWGKRHRRP